MALHHPRGTGLEDADNALSCVAMANKNVRILWAVMTRELPFDAQHMSVKPKAKLPA